MSIMGKSSAKCQYCDSGIAPPLRLEVAQYEDCRVTYVAKGGPS